MALRSRASLRLLFCAAFVAPGAGAQPKPPLVLISIDALHPSYVLEADRHKVALPQLRRLLEQGAHAAAVTGVLPTVTYPSHTTLVTGVSPLRHGIVYNTSFDPLRRNRDGWFWYAEDIRAETLWDAARRAGLRTSNVDWPVTVGAAIDHNIVQYWRTDVPDSADDAKLARALSTPGLLAEAERALGRYPTGYFYTIDADARRAAFSAWMLRTKKPQLHLAYFSGLDEEQHLSGPASPKALRILEQLDGLVGQLRAAADEAAGGSAIVAVVSDHGHSTSTRELRLNEALRAEGLILPDGLGRITDWRALAWGGGGCAAIMLKDAQDADAHAKAARVLERLRTLPDTPIERVLSSEDARKAGGFPDAVFVVALKPDVRLSGRLEAPVLAPALPKGDHGFLPEHPAMDAAFFVAGPGVPAGRALGRIDMRDVAPTLASLLGVSLPNAEGRDVLGGAAR
jgi:predicted AlkP superfamily pyrophosphatase or phosphodiesterase